MVEKIVSNDRLKVFCNQLKKQPFIAVDTEFMREKTYRAVLCLIQVAALDGTAACIDPLAPDLDLKPILDLMKNKKIVKVFHSARQDLEIFYDLMGCLPTPLFDTQVGAMVCGMGESVSYHGIVAHYLGLDLDKSSRVTDWSVRPLSDRQLNYAIADVTNLTRVYEKMMQELKEKNRIAWVEDEMKALLNPALYKVDPNEMWKRLKPQTTKPKYLAVLRALCAWREEKAIRLNRPRRHIMRDEVILELAALSPTNVEDLERMRSKNVLSPRADMAKEIIDAVQSALALPPDQMPQMEREKSLTPAEHSIKEALRLLLTIVCAQIDVAPKIIASAEDLEKISCSDKADVPAMQGWRFDVFGQKAIDFKNGRLAMYFDPIPQKIVFEKR